MRFFFIVCCWLIASSEAYEPDTTIEETFTKYLIVPFVIPAVPQSELSVRFYTKTVKLGNKIPTYATVNPPVVYYNATSSSFYAIVIIDADAPSALAPIYSQYLHAMLLNIPGNNIAQCDYVTPYIPMNPAPGSGFHRIVILLFRQPYKIEITDKFIARLNANYKKFNITEFGNKYNWGDAISGNFFFCELTACEEGQKPLIDWDWK